MGLGLGNKWNHTRELRRRLESQITYEQGVPHFLGRPIISRDTRIDGGVYPGAHRREIIVVDSAKYPLLNKNYARFHTVLPSGPLAVSDALESIRSFVEKALPAGDVGEIIRLAQLYEVKVPLDQFLHLQVGECRHIALFSGFLLERLVDEGRIAGRVSIDRNHTATTAHSWVRFTELSGAPWVLDTAEGYVGPINRGPWDYRRPREIHRAA